jgi:hypothetical protein
MARSRRLRHRFDDEYDEPFEPRARHVDSFDDAPTENSVATDAPAAAQPPESYNRTARVGDMRYHVENVAVHSAWGDSDFAETAKGEFITVQLTVTNLGTESADVANSDFKVVRDGATYDASTAGWMETEGGFGESQINPGLHHTAAVAFDVPANTSPSKYALEVFGNKSEDSALIYLGQ